MFPDFKDLLFVLNAHKVKYLVVGGQAVIIHAQPRATKDLDIRSSLHREMALRCSKRWWRGGVKRGSALLNG